MGTKLKPQKNKKLDQDISFLHNKHMKRTTLMVDEELLEEATRLAGVKTYSKTVELALRDFVRRAEARKILELRGSGLWEGNLSLMRSDSPSANND